MIFTKILKNTFQIKTKTISVLGDMINDMLSNKILNLIVTESLVIVKEN